MKDLRALPALANPNGSLLLVAVAALLIPPALRGVPGRGLDPALAGVLLWAGVVLGALALLGWATLQVRYLLDPTERTLTLVAELSGKRIYTGAPEGRDELVLIGVDSWQTWGPRNRCRTRAVLKAVAQDGRWLTILDDGRDDLAELNREGRRMAESLGLSFAHGEPSRRLTSAARKATRKRAKQRERRRRKV